MPKPQLTEYKESWRDEYLKWICGFANAQGGVLYIGIDDKAKTVGVYRMTKEPHLTDEEIAVVEWR